MPTTNISNAVEQLIKTAWDESYVDAVYRPHPITALFEKKAVPGRAIIVNVKASYGKGRSQSFGTALANANQATPYTFTVPWGIDNRVTQISGPDIEAAQGDTGAIVDITVDALQEAMNDLSDSLERQLARSGFSELGRIATGGISGAVVTLEQKGSVINFRPGDRVQFAQTINAAALRNSGAVGTVASNDPNAGTVTFTATIAAIGAAIVAGDYMFAEGDKADATARLCLGLDAWLPLTRPTAGDSFAGGVDRSVNPDALAGVYVDARGMGIADAINAAVVRLGPVSESRPDTILCSFGSWKKLQDELTALNQNQTVRVQGKGAAADVFFDALTVMTPKGPLPVVACPQIFEDRLYVIDSRKFYLASPSGKPIKSTLDGDPMSESNAIDVYNADAKQYRLRTMAQLVCTFPGASAVVQLQ